MPRGDNAQQGKQGFQPSTRGKEAPAAAAASIAQVKERDEEQPVPYAEQAEKARALIAAKQEAANTGKQGTSAPPLVAEIKQGRATYRFYAPDPETKALLESGDLSIDDALETGRAFPSITTCLGTLDKPALPAWAAGLAADHGENELRALAAMSDEDRQARLDELLSVADPRTGRTVFRKAAGNAHNIQRDSAADRGTDVHALVEQVMLGNDPEVPEDLQGYVDAANEFRRQYPDMRFLYTEATVHNADARTMGTTDGIVEIGGKRYVLDYKTNAKATVYPTTGMQLAAAANANHIVHADGTREPMPKIDGGIGVGLGPDGKMNVYLFETATDGPNHKGFKASRDAWDWKYRSGKQPRPLPPGALN